MVFGGSSSRWVGGCGVRLQGSDWCTKAVVLVNASSSWARADTLQCLGDPLLATHVTILRTSTGASPSAR